MIDRNHALPIARQTELVGIRATLNKPSPFAIQ